MERYLNDNTDMSNKRKSVKISNIFQNVSLNPNNPVLRLTRAGDTLTDIPNIKWTVFTSDSKNYLPVEWGFSNKLGYENQRLAPVILVSFYSKMLINSIGDL